MFEQPVNAPMILLVDDDADMTMGLSDRLTAEGCQVAIAHSGLEALHWLQGHRPSAVLLDFHMPEMDGIKTLQAIHTVDSKIPVIIVTGAEPQELLRHRELYTAAAYLPKPVEWTVLRQTLIVVLGQWLTGGGARQRNRLSSALARKAKS
jgi:CheY-like chemotaxis protein